MENGGTLASTGYIELEFSKAMRQAPNTEITFNGDAVRVSINYEKVRYTFSNDYEDLEDGDECTFIIPAGALTDMDGRACESEISVTFTISSSVSGDGTAYDAVVDVDGNGDYTTIQAAIDAASFNLTSPYNILILNGTYEECIRVRQNKNYIHLIGESREGVKIQYALNRVGSGDGDQGTATDESWEYSCNNSSSPVRQDGYTAEQNCVALIEGDHFYASNLSIINLYGALSSRYSDGLGKDGQAEALITRGTDVALNKCLLVSFQDTWWHRPLSGSITTNLAYVYNSQIEGRTDYVWGSGDILVENSTFYNTGNSAYITASGSTGNWGYVMRGCTVDGEDGITAFSFGRPYQNNTQTVWINTTLEMNIVDDHWTTWSAIPTLYAEYNTVGLDGNVIDKGDSWTVGSGDYSFTARTLSASDAANYTYENIVASTGWDPQEYMEEPGAPGNIVLSGTTLSWNEVSGAAGYVIFLSGTYVGQTTSTSVTVNDASSTAVYTVRAVNEYGTFGESGQATIE